MHTCVMTVTYLRGGLSASSVLLLLFHPFFLKFIKFVMQLCEKMFKAFEKHGSYLLFLERFELPGLFSRMRLSCACLQV